MKNVSALIQNDLYIGNIRDFGVLNISLFSRKILDFNEIWDLHIKNYVWAGGVKKNTKHWLFNDFKKIICNTFMNIFGRHYRV